jgi:surface polysaccharide O-acyltransferase-like enzyme
MSGAKQREIWLDNLRIIAIIGVVIIHVSAKPQNLSVPIEPNISWVLYPVYHAAARFCVPLFVMISGAIQLNQTTSALSFYRKRIPRMFLILFVWGSIYILFKHIFNSPYNLKGYIGAFLFSSTACSYHLWFLYLIVELYLITPLLWKLFKKVSIDQVSRKAVLVSLVFVILFFDFTPLRIIGFDRTTLISAQSSPDYLLLFIGYIPYYLLGKVIRDLKPRFSSTQILALTIVFFASLTYGSFFSIKMHSETFFGYMSINVFIATICLFCSIQRLGEIPILGNNQLNTKISELSFGIYLVHELVIETFQLFNVNAFIVPPLLGIPIYTPIIFIVSYYLTIGLRRNKLARLIM